VDTFAGIRVEFVVLYVVCAALTGSAGCRRTGFSGLELKLSCEHGAGRKNDRSHELDRNALTNSQKHSLDSRGMSLFMPKDVLKSNGLIVGHFA